MEFGGLLLPSVFDFIEDRVLNSEFANYIDLFEARGRNPVIEGKPTDVEIIRAIENRKYIGIYYEEKGNDDVLDGFRLIQPMVYGKGYVHHNGKVVHPNRKYLRAYVIKDSSKEKYFMKGSKLSKRKSVSKSKTIPYWRLFRIDRVSSWSEFPRTFSKYRELYNPDDKMINNIIANIKKDEFPYGKDKIRLPRKLRYKK